MALQSTNWRCIFALFEYLNERRLLLELSPYETYSAKSAKKVLSSDAKLLAIKEAEDEDDEENEEQLTLSKSLFDEICRLLRGVMKNGPSKNQKVKRLAAYSLFPRLFNLTKPILSYS